MELAVILIIPLGVSILHARFIKLYLKHKNNGKLKTRSKFSVKQVFLSVNLTDGGIFSDRECF